MNGQLWQECYCGTEPVCSTCEKCQKHCRCGKSDSQVSQNFGGVCPEPYRRGIGQGFGSTEDGEC